MPSRSPARPVVGIALRDVPSSAFVGLGAVAVRPAAAIGATPTPTPKIATATNTARTNICPTSALSSDAIPPQTRANSTQQRSKITNSDSKRQLALLAGTAWIATPSHRSATPRRGYRAATAVRPAARMGAARQLAGLTAAPRAVYAGSLLPGAGVLPHSSRNWPVTRQGGYRSAILVRVALLALIGLVSVEFSHPADLRKRVCYRVAENIGHVKSVGQMTGVDTDPLTGRALAADGVATVLAGRAAAPPPRRTPRTSA